MKKIIENKTFINLINFAIIFVFFSYLFIKLRFAMIANDDMLDLVVGGFDFFHGRFVSDFIARLLVTIIPQTFNLSIQNFAIVSSGIVKPAIFLGLCYICSSMYFVFKKKNIMQSFWLILSFFIILSFLHELHFIWTFHILQCYFGYVLPMIYFLAFWYVFGNIYLDHKKADTKSTILLSVLAALIVMGNEELNAVLLVLLVIIFGQKFIEARKERLKTDINYIIYPLIISLTISLFVWTSSGLKSVMGDYGLSCCIDLSKKQIFDFISVYIQKIFIHNLLLWVPVIICCICILRLPDYKEINKKVLNYVLVSYCGFFLFFASLYTLGPSFNYENYPDYYLYPRYWILHPGLLFDFKVFLYATMIFLFGYLSYRISSKKVTYTILSIIILGFCIQIFNHFEELQLSSYNTRRTLYLLDKFSVYYFSKGKTAILPTDHIDCILPIYNDSWPKDLESKAYVGKIYNNPEKYLYLKYIKIVYKVDPMPGMTFVSENQAIQKFKENGGHFEKDELQKLNFNLIK